MHSICVNGLYSCSLHKEVPYRSAAWFNPNQLRKSRHVTLLASKLEGNLDSVEFFHTDDSQLRYCHRLHRRIPWGNTICSQLESLSAARDEIRIPSDTEFINLMLRKRSKANLQARASTYARMAS